MLLDLMLMNITLVIVVLILLAVFVLFNQTTLFAKPTGIYQTIIVAKEEKHTILYTGAFIPMKIYIIKTSENREIQIERDQYDRLMEGDKVKITSYSNGLHKLQS